VQAMKANGVYGGVAPLILWLYMEVSGQLHAPASLLTSQKTLVPTNRRLCGSRNLCGSSEEEKNRLSLPGIELRFLGHSVHKLVTIPTTDYTTLVPHTCHQNKASKISTGNWCRLQHRTLSHYFLYF
jgi:hypothetical protein